MTTQQGRTSTASGPLLAEDLCARLDRLDRAWALRAAQAYTELRDLLEELSAEELLADPDLGIQLCAAWQRTGELDRALDLALRLAASCEARGNDRLYRERTNLEAIIRIGQCDYAGAEPLLYEVLDAAVRAGDDLFLGHACSNLGTIAIVRCHWDAAVSHIRRALACFQRIGYLRGIGANHHNLALVYHGMGRLREAEDHVVHSAGYLPFHGSEDELGQLEIERAELRVESGDLALAKALLQRAESRLARLGHGPLYAEVLRAKGAVAAAEGRGRDAEDFFSSALELARATSNRFTEGIVLTDLAILAARQGSAAPAEARLREARAVFVAIGSPERARRSEARVRALLPH